MKTKLAIATVFVLFSFLGCYNNQAVKNIQPDIVLTKNQMIDIMTDVQILEASLNRKRDLGQNITMLKVDWYNQVFVHHKISNQIFEDNLVYYNQLSDEMEKILDEVSARINQMKSEDNTKNS